MEATGRSNLFLCTHMYTPPPKRARSSSVPKRGAAFKTKIVDVNKGEILLLLRSWGEEEVNLLPGNKKQPNLDA